MTKTREGLWVAHFSEASAALDYNHQRMQFLTRIAEAVVITTPTEEQLPHAAVAKFLVNIISQPVRFLIAAYNDEPVGCAIVQRMGTRKQPFGVVRLLAIHPEHQHKGFGNRLLAAMEEDVESSLHEDAPGCDMHIWTPKGSEIPQHFCSRNGYTRIGESTTRLGTHIIPTDEYAKVLTPKRASPQA